MTIKCWHTLTYMCLNIIENGDYRLSVVTENGYLFVWDIASNFSEMIGSSEDQVTNLLRYSNRISTGSIEALNIRHFNGVTKGISCSSDCSSSLI